MEKFFAWLVRAFAWMEKFFAWLVQTFAWTIAERSKEAGSEMEVPQVAAALAGQAGLRSASPARGPAVGGHRAACVQGLPGRRPAAQRPEGWPRECGSRLRAAAPIGPAAWRG